ncbi:MAG TPA: CHC2 zinc finger domain-containing protein [Anaerolineales bacterium]|jgi:hypothetical protein
MDAQTVNETFDLLDLVERDTALKSAGAYHVGACPFCGGRDRFTLKHTPHGDRWHCRKCGDGKYHTAIDYIMRRESLDFKEALSQMGGDVQSIAPRPRTEPARPVIVLPGQDWQRDALREVWAGSDAIQSPEGKPGREYLYRRGIRLETTATVWQVGFSYIFDSNLNLPRPALVLPWWERTQDGADPTITAIKYRFIDNKTDGGRYTSRKGSVMVLYGLWDVLSCHHTLLLVEGEINALSCWQVQPEGVTVLSFGSEGATRPEILKAIAKRYRRAFVWADDPKRAENLRGILPGSVALRSPEIDGLKWDANQMLQARTLAEVLSRKLGVNCEGLYI